jgi:hypothetical protein
VEGAVEAAGVESGVADAVEESEAVVRKAIAGFGVHVVQPKTPKDGSVGSPVEEPDVVIVGAEERHRVPHGGDLWEPPQSVTVECDLAVWW